MKAYGKSWSYNVYCCRYCLYWKGKRKGCTYEDLKKVRDELRELSVHKANYEELRDLEEREERKEKERGRE